MDSDFNLSMFSEFWEKVKILFFTRLLHSPPSLASFTQWLRNEWKTKQTESRFLFFFVVFQPEKLKQCFVLSAFSLDGDFDSSSLLSFCLLMIRKLHLSAGLLFGDTHTNTHTDWIPGEQEFLLPSGGPVDPDGPGPPSLSANRTTGDQTVALSSSANSRTSSDLLFCCCCRSSDSSSVSSLSSSSSLKLYFPPFHLCLGVFDWCSCCSFLFSFSLDPSGAQLCFWSPSLFLTLTFLSQLFSCK